MIRKILISESNDVYFNLALEEYLIRHTDFSHVTILLIYINDESIVLGKNQNVLNEINLQYLFDADVKIARRISGGGTVVHDRGNINFAIFEKHEIKKVNRYESSIGFMVEVLKSLAIDCYQTDRNAIFLSNNKKIAGSAQFSSSSAILSHFSLLFVSNIHRIQEFLKPNYYTIESKSSTSFRSEIDVLKKYTVLNQDEFIRYVIGQWGASERHILSDIDLNNIEKLCAQKYRSLHFIYNTACTGILKYNQIILELEKGKILRISGIEDDQIYIGTDLFMEMGISNSIWDKLKME